ncbi:MAG TPA: hypothetical protein VJB59_06385 [Bdellovibrionota bacterium]|nr:hypothetical protein [Bdellovibrionota bacterium]
MKLFIVSAVSCFIALSAYAGGTTENGGDICENRIQTIAADLDAWIAM